jgi:hypothetical protein
MEKIFKQPPPVHPALLYEDMVKMGIYIWSNMTFETHLWIDLVSSIDCWNVLKQISIPSDSTLNCIKTVVSKYLFLFFESAKISTADLTSFLLKTATESSASMHSALQRIKTLCKLISIEFIVSTIIDLQFWAQPNRNNIFSFSQFQRKTFYTSPESNQLLKIERKSSELQS